MPLCNRCAQSIDIQDLSPNGYCLPCSEGRCPRCLSITDNRDFTATLDGIEPIDGVVPYSVCLTCAGRGRCGHCELTFPQANLDLNRNCRSCRYVTCQGCGNRYRRCDLDSDMRCSVCEFHECSGCGGRVAHGTLDENNECPACAGTDDSEDAGQGQPVVEATDELSEGPIDRGLHEAGYRPMTFFIVGKRERPWFQDHYMQSPFNRGRSFTKVDDRPYYGMEIEIEIPAPGRGRRQKTRDEVALLAPGGWYAKADSSIGNRGINGVEFVSHPRTYRKWLWTDLEWIPGIAWNTNCGIHIHVSKRSVTQATLFKVIQLFRENWGYIHRISRRKGKLLEQYSGLDTHVSEAYARSIGKRPCGNKYLAVNTEHNATIEFRIFAGTTNAGSIKRNLAWLHAVLSWAAETSFQEVNVPSFHQWLESPKGARALNEQMVSRVLAWSLEATSPKPARRTNV